MSETNAAKAGVSDASATNVSDAELFYKRALARECPRCLAARGRPCSRPNGETVIRGRPVPIHRPRMAQVPTA